MEAVIRRAKRAALFAYVVHLITFAFDSSNATCTSSSGKLQSCQDEPTLPGGDKGVHPRWIRNRLMSLTCVNLHPQSVHSISTHHLLFLMNSKCLLSIHILGLAFLSYAKVRTPCFLNDPNADVDLEHYFSFCLYNDHHGTASYMWPYDAEDVLAPNKAWPTTISPTRSRRRGPHIPLGPRHWHQCPCNTFWYRLGLTRPRLCERQVLHILHKKSPHHTGQYQSLRGSWSMTTTLVYYYRVQRLVALFLHYLDHPRIYFVQACQGRNGSLVPSLRRVL